MPAPDPPETFEAIAWAKYQQPFPIPLRGLFFDLKNRTVTRAVWDEDNNLVEMTYGAVTGRVLKKQITKT
jgi:hypothetical protein